MLWCQMLANNAKYRDFLCVGRSYDSLFIHVATNILNSGHFGKFVHLSPSTPGYFNKSMINTMQIKHLLKEY